MFKRNVVLFLMLSCLLAAPVRTEAAPMLTGSGCSVSTVGYLIDLAKEYEKETGVRMHIIGGGSLRGLTDLSANKVDFAASCKGPTRQDPANWTFIRVAWDALVFIVHRSNPVNEITPEKVRDIYAGHITNWSQLGGKNMKLISFLAPPKGMGGVGQSLTRMVLRGNPPAKAANTSIQASSTAILEQLVEKTPEGFSSSGFSSAKKRTVKMLKVNGVSPTKETIISDKYPLRRPLYLVIDKNASPEVKKFVDYVLGRKGQGLIASYGMVSLSEVK
ncbi:MAG: substrate-binding domain-containing protein [Thermodesulfovibrionales bacterium]